MINFINQQSNSLLTVLLCTLVAMLLQGCGAERTTPYDPITPSNCSSSSRSSSSSEVNSSSSSSSSSCVSSSSSTSSSSSSASSVAQELLWSATKTATVIDKKEKNVQVIRTDTDFYKLADAYVDRVLEVPDLTTGQVVLIDDGDVDSCAAHLEFNSKLTAVELTDASVKVTVNYIEKPTLTNCSSTFTRPYYFYYLKTKKLLVFEEKIAD